MLDPKLLNSTVDVTSPQTSLTNISRSRTSQETRPFGVCVCVCVCMCICGQCIQVASSQTSGLLFWCLCNCACTEMYVWNTILVSLTQS